MSPMNLGRQTLVGFHWRPEIANANNVLEIVSHLEADPSQAERIGVWRALGPAAA